MLSMAKKSGAQGTEQDCWQLHIFICLFTDMGFHFHNNLIGAQKMYLRLHSNV